MVNQGVSIPTVVPTPEEFAKRICIAHGKSIEAILETGKILIEAKRCLNHGDWLKIFNDNDIPFGERTAQRLIKIRMNEALSNPTHMSFLPTSWGTLYELIKIPNLNQAIEEGKIHADMQRKDVETLLPEKLKKIKKFDTDTSERRIRNYLQKEYDQWPKNYRKARFENYIKSILKRICHEK